MKKLLLALTYRNIFKGRIIITLLIIKLLVNKANDDSSMVSEIISNASDIRKFNKEEN